MRYLLTLALLSLATVTHAQQSPDPALLQQIAASLQTQRNEALDRAAVAEAQARMAQSDSEKLKARVKELEGAILPSGAAGTPRPQK